jgi:hypothetical protein
VLVRDPPTFFDMIESVGGTSLDRQVLQPVVTAVVVPMMHDIVEIGE